MIPNLEGEPRGSGPRRILLVFLDGVGVGEDDPRRNAMVSADLPHLRALLGGRLPVLPDASRPGGVAGKRARLVCADATLDAPGLPQSGTGQAALLTGINAAERFGRHFGPWVPTSLRELVRQQNLLSRAAAAGRSVAFANAHPLRHPRLRGSDERRPAAPTLAARAAGVLCRDDRWLRQGRAVASSITHERWREHVDPELPDIPPSEAGRVLARIAGEADLTLFAHYDTDFAGHRRDLAVAVAALERVDAFLGGVLDGLEDDTLLVLSSDHGNIEDCAAGHTRNPVPVLAVGPGRDTIAHRVRGLTDVAPALLALLGA